MDHYRKQEQHIQHLFEKPHSLDPSIRLEEIISKVCILNAFYSTEINSPIHVAKRIASIRDFVVKVAETSRKSCSQLVARIAKGGDILVGTGNDYGNPRDCYSFATKYCHHHNRDSFRICDSYVVQVLSYFKKDFFDKKKFSNIRFSIKRMKTDYAFFHDVFEAFKSHPGFCLNKFSNWQLDKYLWLLGKKYFPRKKQTEAE